MIIIKNLRMIDQPAKQIMDVLHAQQPASRNFTQSFQYAHNTITHQHHLEVEIIQERTQKMEIRNHFATMNGQRLIKLTEIQLQNRIIKIVDIFTSNNNHQHIINDKIEPISHSFQQNYPRHTLLSKKYKSSIISEGSEQLRIRDTKNIVKNLIRLFQGWIEKHYLGQSDIDTYLAQLLSRNKFNNHLIIKLSKIQLLRKYFIIFSERQGEQWISQSKIHDKSSHLQALKKYRKICDDQQQLYQMGLPQQRKVEINQQYDNKQIQ